MLYDNNIFTRREIDCIKMLVTGHSAKIAAYKLNIAKRTYDMHIANAKLKLHCRKSTEFIYKLKLNKMLDKFI